VVAVVVAVLLHREAGEDQGGGGHELVVAFAVGSL
jgi:hypothetical protein